MRVLVCGGRDYDDMNKVFSTLDDIGPSLIIEGGASGADNLAWRWSKRRGVERLTFQADWSRDGKAAGPMRNQRMLEEGRPDMVVAFAGGRGTADMVRRAQRAGVQVVQVPA